MPHHPRIETKDYAAFTTSRTRHSELWFINNPQFQYQVLALIAKYSVMYNVTLYAIAIEGSHVHHLADFPEENCSEYKKALNSMIARTAPKYCVKYHNYRFWDQRYSKELIPHHPDDLLKKFIYTVLQPVQDGLVQKISEYPGYNCLSDSIRGIKRKYKIVDWTSYNRAKRAKYKKVNIKDYTREYTLKFHRMPGFDDLTNKEYQDLVSSKVEERRTEVVKARLEDGKGFVGREKLLKTKPGKKAKNPKVSHRYSIRPRTDAACAERIRLANRFYFDCQDLFRKASVRYRNGFLDTEFPPGMYRPHLSTKVKNELDKKIQSYSLPSRH